MIGVSAVCCFPADIAVRLIGCISLLTHVLVFVALVSASNEVLNEDKIRIIFGFDSRFFNYDNQSEDGNEWFPIFCLAFTLTSSISSALLIWASIVAQRWLTVPWLLCSAFDVACHFLSLAKLSIRRSPSPGEWVTAATVFYSVALLYFTLIVMMAHYFWWIQSKETQKFTRNLKVFNSPSLFEHPQKNPEV